MSDQTMQEFRVWWLDAEQAELRTACAEGWAFMIWNASRKVHRLESEPLPVMGFTGCLVCGKFTNHGGLQCPKTLPMA